MRRLLSGMLAVCLAAGLTGCSTENRQNSEDTFSPASRKFFAMNTYISLAAYGDAAADALVQAEARIEELEGLWSVTDENSEIYAVNHSEDQPVSVSEDTTEIISFALEMAEETGGALEPTIYPVLTAWGFTTDEYRVPSPQEITGLLENVDYRKVSVSGNTIQLEPDMMLDLGAVGKGYASDKIASLLRRNGITSAMLNLGGNIVMIGSRSDGSGWRLGLQNPFGDDTIGVLTAADCAVVTSGNYENFFTAEDGITYGHIIDPATGYPVNNDLASVTIVAKEGKLCDALSTSLFVMGMDEAVEYWRKHPGFEMILITQDQQILITEGMEEQFSLAEAHSNMTVEMIER